MPNDRSNETRGCINLVGSVNKHGILLEVVQVLADLDLVIKKAYISSDGGWFMDVFNVICHDGRKIRDEGVVSYIKKVLERDTFYVPSLNGSVGLKLMCPMCGIGVDTTDCVGRMVKPSGGWCVFG